MTTFDKREEGFEKKFAHDEELKFKAFARRNKLLGLWAAGLLGKSGADADAYAKEIVMADLAEHGDDDVVAKLKADLGRKATEQQIRGQMSELLAAGGRANHKDRLTWPPFPSPAGCAPAKRFSPPGRRSLRRSLSKRWRAKASPPSISMRSTGMWDVASIIAGIGAVRHAGGAARARARAARGFRAGVARARFRRRSRSSRR